MSAPPTVIRAAATKLVAAATLALAWFLMIHGSLVALIVVLDPLEGVASTLIGVALYRRFHFGLPWYFPAYATVALLAGGVLRRYAVAQFARPGAEAK